MELKERSMIRRCTALAAAILLVAAGMLIPLPEGLSRQGLCALCLMGANIVCWIGDVAPKSVVGLASVVLLPLLGIADNVNDVFKNFSNSILFFLLAAAALSVAVKNSSIPQRIMRFFLRVFGRSTRLIILAFMTTTAVVSAVMTDLAACVLCAAVAIPLFQDDERFSQNPNFVKCMFIGIPAAALAGGTATPIGSASNITMMGLLGESIGLEVSWARWMAVGIPLSLISLFATWFVMTAILRPKRLSQEELASFQHTLGNLKPLNVFDIKTIAILVALLLLWTFSDVIHVNTTIVALAGMVIIFMPGMDLVTWKEFKEEAPWDMLIMLGSLFALAAYLLSTKAVDWISNVVLAQVGGLSPFFFLLVICTMIALMRGATPAGAPIVSMLTPIFVTMAAGMGIDPFCIVILMSVWAQITFLLPPCDALYLVTYSLRRYSILDVLKFGVPLTVGLLVLYSAIVPPMVALTAAL